MCNCQSKYENNKLFFLYLPIVALMVICVGKHKSKSNSSWTPELYCTALIATDTPLTVRLLPLQFTVSHQNTKQAQARKIILCIVNKNNQLSGCRTLPYAMKIVCAVLNVIWESNDCQTSLLWTGYTGQLPGVKPKGIACSANIPN